MLADFYDLSQAERMVYVFLASCVLGLVLGVFLQRSSVRRMPVRGGLPAQFFHYLAASAIAVLIPGLVLGIL
ncbi:MAG: hypothetical protein HC915_07450 [Anaerolineae bacterium]|nr:hypothetical protein [Anaerolineae bacterium]